MCELRYKDDRMYKSVENVVDFLEDHLNNVKVVPHVSSYDDDKLDDEIKIVYGIEYKRFNITHLFKMTHLLDIDHDYGEVCYKPTHPFYITKMDNLMDYSSTITGIELPTYEGQDIPDILEYIEIVTEDDPSLFN